MLASVLHDMSWPAAFFCCFAVLVICCTLCFIVVAITDIVDTRTTGKTHWQRQLEKRMQLAAERATREAREDLQ